MHARPIPRLMVLLFAMLLPVACAKRPIFYPNAHYDTTAPDVQQQDIDQCLTKAEEYVASGGEAREAAVSAGKGAVIGGAGGAVGGAIWGNAGRGAAAGAAGGAAAGLLNRLLFRDRPKPVVRRYVEHCLHEKGYETLGWQ